MNRLTIAAALCLAVSTASAGGMSEKEKAMANPYPNDFGPEALSSATLKGYPANIQAGYTALIKGCAQCHSAARPLNSRFVEPEGGTDDKAQEAALAKLKKEQPDLFKDPSVWQVETKIWNRYVKRMMNKPGCAIDKKDGKAIWEFLVYDSIKRKTGERAAAWAAQRKGLIETLKAKNPKRYEELKASGDL